MSRLSMERLQPHLLQNKSSFSTAWAVHITRCLDLAQDARCACETNQPAYAPGEDLQQLHDGRLAALGVRLCAGLCADGRERCSLGLQTLLYKSIEQLLCAGLRLQSTQADQGCLSLLPGRHTGAIAGHAGSSC